MATSQYAGDAQRIAIQIGGTWYASTSTIAPPGGVAGNQFGSAAQPFSLNFTTDASAWRVLNFTPGSPLTLGAALTQPLPDGEITGFGLYLEIADQSGMTNERTYFDTFTISATACLPCDLNCDGSVNPFDIQPFIAALSPGGPAACSSCAGDANGDGTVNPFDIQSFIECLGG